MTSSILLSGSDHRRDVLLLRTRASQRVRGVLQPPVRLHPLLSVQLPREPGDTLGRIYQVSGAGAGGHEGSVQ